MGGLSLMECLLVLCLMVVVSLGVSSFRGHDGDGWRQHWWMQGPGVDAEQAVVSWSQALSDVHARRLRVLLEVS